MVNRDEEDRYFADSPDCDFREDDDDDSWYVCVDIHRQHEVSAIQLILRLQ